ncbi:MAG TPA: hypothetical protein VHE55_04545 [Fimbriimonadaceae bacterium]|nr:hypothetical protein [Fimbriimonadaceae bacterium]
MMFRPLASAALLLALGGSVIAQKPPTAPATSTGAIPQSALAQLPPPAYDDTLHMESHVASFKIVPKGDAIPSGRLEFSFEGTVLVNGLTDGSFLQTTGNVRKEYENKEHGRQVFFGRGKILIVGKFRACQWFGRDLDFTFKGSGIVRVIAEFDQKLDTGTFWFDPAKKNALQVNLIPIIVPHPRDTPEPAITREEFNKMKKQKGG